VKIVRTFARKPKNRLNFCWLKVICCICQSNELEGEIKQKPGVQPKTCGGHCPPLEPPLTINIICHVQREVWAYSFFLFSRQLRGNKIFAWCAGLWVRQHKNFTQCKLRKRVKPPTNKVMLFFLLLMLLFRSVCHQVSNQADKLDLLAIFNY